jgi:hypothetical protein
MLIAYDDPLLFADIDAECGSELLAGSGSFEIIGVVLALASEDLVLAGGDASVPVDIVFASAVPASGTPSTGASSSSSDSSSP